MFNINSSAKLILNRLFVRGYEAYIVGGCVRDILMGKQPHDWDICTTAKPDEIKEIFSDFQTIDIGIAHGTVAVVANGKIFEVTTMRTEGDYTDNRHPKSVCFIDKIELDLSRRDFTVNALAYSEKSGLIDVFGGADDISYMTIRCVGEPDKRFLEDGLRIMRALRFSSVLGFKIEEKTSESIHKNRSLLKNISAERIREELVKLLMGENCEKVLTEYSDVVIEVIPQLECSVNFLQNTKHHSYDVYTHIIKSVSLVKKDELLRVVMLLHDIGKPFSYQIDDTVTHFKGHDKKSAEIAQNVLKNLRFSNDFIADAITLIKYHDLRPSPNRRSVRRAVSKIGTELFPKFLEIQKADTLAQSMYNREEKIKRINCVAEIFDEIIAQNDCLKITDLDINGNDLIKAGYSGKEIGDMLKRILYAVMDDEIKNNREEIINFLKKSLL